MTDVSDKLDAAMSKDTGGYPPWWDPETEGDTLQGTVNALRHDPFGDDSGTVMEVVVGLTKPLAVETRTHAILTRLIDNHDVAEGDMVKVRYDGQIETSNGMTANDYALGVVHADDLDVDTESFAE